MSQDRTFTREEVEHYAAELQMANIECRRLRDQIRTMTGE
jgi:hypothetical protein